MIPAPLRWIAAIVALGIIVAVVTPFAIDAARNSITFGSDDTEAEPSPSPTPTPTPTEAQEADAAQAAEAGALESTHTVQAGDTLRSIASALYGDGAQWRRIAEANGLGGESVLRVGQVLQVPAAD